MRNIISVTIVCWLVSLPYEVHCQAAFNYSRSYRLFEVRYVSSRIIYTYDKLGNRLSKLTSTGTPLPVGLVDFKGRSRACANQLSWNVGKDAVVSNYRLERSTDGQRFTAVYQIKASSNPSYAYNDANPPRGNNFYRLATVAHSGTETYSNTIRIVNTCGLMSGAKLSPNPASSSVQLSFNAAAAGVPCEFSICDMLGRVVLSAAITTTGALQQFSYDISLLPPANYSCRLSAGQETLLNEKLTVVK